MEVGLKIGGSRDVYEIVKPEYEHSKAGSTGVQIWPKDEARRGGGAIYLTVDHPYGQHPLIVGKDCIKKVGRMVLKSFKPQPESEWPF